MRKRGSSHSHQGPSTPARTPALRSGTTPAFTIRSALALRNGFTLLELILVMLILAIAAMAVVPSVTAFAVGRATDNASIMILNLASYARTQAISEGKTFRLNFDTQAGEVYLTEGSAGVFTAPTNDFGRHFPLAPGIKMDVDVTPQPNAMLVMSPTIQQTPVQPAPAFGQAVTDITNNLIELPRVDPGTYVEFQPSGRTDPVHIKLTDKAGKLIDLGLATSTDVMHQLTAKEMQ